MPFTLEALQARHGDCLLLHYGTDAEPRLMVIDGGPGGVFAAELLPRLTAIRKERVAAGRLDAGAPLPIDLLMCSHIDDDHIQGLLSLLGRIRERREAGKDEEWSVATLWLNAFEQLVGDPDAGKAASAGQVAMASAVIASVPQGGRLRDHAEGLGIPLNAPFHGLVRGAPAGSPPHVLQLDGGLRLTIVGPDALRLDDLQEKWENYKPKARKENVSPAAYLDESVYNLSSIVALAEWGEGDARRRILLTGDALGRDVLEWLRTAGLLGDGPDARLELDVLKVPHHGSDRNVGDDFFAALPARDYVISGDGEHGNPELETLRMIARAGEGRPYRLHLTYEDGHDDLGEKVRKFRAEFPDADVVFARPGEPLQLALG